MRTWLALVAGSSLLACSSAPPHASPDVDAGTPHRDAHVEPGDAKAPPLDATGGEKRARHADSGRAGGPKDAGDDLGFLEPTATLGPIPSAPLTTSQIIAASHAVVADPSTSMAPSTPSVLDGWLADGYGVSTTTAGEPLVPMSPPGMTAPASGPNAKMLLRFVHLPDIQLADDESPNRLCEYDEPYTVVSTDGAFRAQEADECRILDAAVRTINAIHAATPLSFVLTGGDNADNAQTNEIGWFLQIMDGAKSVKCDSGDYDDPVPGPNNDGKDPFDAVGLDVPWWWVTGNHDVLVQGNYVVDATSQARAVGTMALGETRDYRLPGGALSAGPLIPDPRRLPLVRTDLMKLVGSDADGHGVGASQIASGKAFYSFDVPNTPLRFIILDTPAETGADNGVVHQADLTSTIKPLFDQALADQKLVITASHHSTDQITDGSGLGGTAQADALTRRSGKTSSAATTTSSSRWSATCTSTASPTSPRRPATRSGRS